MEVLFSHIDTDSAPNWQNILNDLHPDVAILGKNGLMAVMGVCPPNRLDKTRLLVPSREDSRYSELGPELRNMQLSVVHTNVLLAGAASLVLARSVTGLICHDKTSKVGQNDGSVLWRMPVSGTGNLQADCVKPIDEMGGGVTSFWARRPPRVNDSPNREIVVGAVMSGEQATEWRVRLCAPVAEDGREVIVMEEGSRVNTEDVPQLRPSHPMAILAMGRALAIATAPNDSI